MGEMEIPPLAEVPLAKEAKYNQITWIICRTASHVACSMPKF